MVLTYPATLADLDRRLLNQMFSTQAAPDYADEQRRRDALNHGCRKVYQLLCNKMANRWFTREWTDLAPNNNVIQLPPDCKRVYHGDKRVGNGWTPITIVAPSRQFEYSRTVDLPAVVDANTIPQEVWTQIETTLRNDGPGLATGTYRVRGQYELQDMQKPTDPCPIPSDYQDMPIYWAAQLIFSQAGREDRAAVNVSLYQKEEQDLIQSAGLQNLTEQGKARRTRPWSWRQRAGLGW